MQYKIYVGRVNFHGVYVLLICLERIPTYYYVQQIFFPFLIKFQLQK